MANGYGIPILSGLLKGLGGLPQGMQQREELDIANERTAQGQQALEQDRLFKMLGIQRQALEDQQAQAQRRQTEELRGRVPEQARPFLGVPGGADLYKLLYGQEAQSLPPGFEPTSVTRGGVTYKPPAPPETPIPPGMVPSSMTRGGVTYKAPGGDDTGRTLAERVAMARMTAATNPTPEAQANLGRLEQALKIETGLAGARAGAAVSGRTAAEQGAPLSATDAASLGVPFGTTQQQAAGKTALTQTQRTKMDAQNAVLAIIDNLEADIKGVALPKGPGERPGAIPGAMVGVYGQTDPARTALHGRLEGTLSLIVRALGEVGTLNEGDIRRAKALMPTVAPIPDTEPVAREKLKKLRELVQEIAGRTGAAVPGRGTPAPTPAAGPVIKWGRDAQGRPMPLP